jgi:stage III sporulation protein AB
MFAIRLTLSIAATFAFYRAGSIYGLKYVERQRHLRELRSALRALETEVVYSRTTLGAAFGRLAGLDLGAGTLLFAAMAKELEGVTPAREAWLAAAGAASSGLALDDEDWRIVGSLANCLGQSDTADQAAHLALVRGMLEERERHAAEDARRNGRLWSYLGGLAGLGMVLLLF